MKKNKLICLRYIFIATVFLIFITRWSTFFDGYNINGDDRFYFFILKYIDPELFPGMLTLYPQLYFMFLPCGINFLIYIFTKFFSLYTVTLIMPFLISLSTVFIVFKLGVYLKNRFFAFMVSVVFLFIYFSSKLTMYSLSPPVFGFFFIVLFIYFLVTDNDWAAMLTVVVSTFFYPKLLFIFFMTFFWECFKISSKAVRIKKIKIFIMGVLLCTLYFISFINYYPGLFGDSGKIKFCSSEENRRIAQFKRWDNSLGNSVNNELGFVFSESFFLGEVFGIGKYKTGAGNIYLFAGIILGLLCFFVRRNESNKFLTVFSLDIPLPNKKAIGILLFFGSFIFNIIAVITGMISPYGGSIFTLLFLTEEFIILYPLNDVRINRIFQHMLLSGIVIFVLISVCPLQYGMLFHYRSRQLTYVLPIFLIFFSVYNFEDKFLKKLKKNTPLYLLGIMLFFVFLSSYIMCIGERGFLPARSVLLYKYLETLPKNIIVADDPQESDFIPFFGKRMIFLSVEWGGPMIKKSWESMAERTRDYFLAVYSKTENEFLSFCLKYRDTDLYFVVRKDYFTDEFINEKKMEYFNLFNITVDQMTNNRNFFLKLISEEKKVFKTKELFVLRCKDFL